MPTLNVGFSGITQPTFALTGQAKSSVSVLKSSSTLGSLRQRTAGDSNNAPIECALHYTGNRSSGADHIMGTVMFSILNGHWRYAHISRVCGTVRENTVRLAMYCTEGKASIEWYSTWILGCISPVLLSPAVIDYDVTVNPTYGYQVALWQDCSDS